MCTQHMKLIPASAHILICFPAGINRHPTMSIPVAAQDTPVRSSFRPPKSSTIADPVRADSGSAAVDEIKLSLPISIGDTSEPNEYWQEIYIQSNLCGCYLHVIIPSPASCPQIKIMAQCANWYQLDGESNTFLKVQSCLSPPSYEITSPSSGISNLTIGGSTSLFSVWFLARIASASFR